MKPRKIIVLGWDGRSNPIYRYQDELRRMPDHMRSIPPKEAILAQFPNATWTTADYQRIPLAQAYLHGVNTHG